MDDLGSTTVHEVKVENKYRNGVCYHLRVCVCVWLCVRAEEREYQVETCQREQENIID